MAIVLDEPEAQRCRDVLVAHETVLVSAATVTEALVAATRRSVGEQMAALIDAAELQVVDVTRESAFAAARASLATALPRAPPRPGCVAPAAGGCSPRS